MVLFNCLHYQIVNSLAALARILYKPAVILRQYLTLAVEVLPWTN
jgi:hypothetical protein